LPGRETDPNGRSWEGGRATIEGKPRIIARSRRLKAWVPVVSVIVGACLTIFIEAMRDRFTTRREREMRQDERAAQRAEERRRFQRETLLALQEALQRLATAATDALSENLRAHRNGAVWGQQLLSEELNRRIMEATLTGNMLRVRVEDDQLRDMAEGFSARAQGFLTAHSEEEAVAAFQRASQACDAVHERLGALLRALT
jgi:hypothetical protein